MTIDKEKAIIYGEFGSVSYFVNDSGGVEITDELDAGLTDDEFTEACEEIDETK